MKKNIAKQFLAASLTILTMPVWAIPFTATLPDSSGPFNGGSILKSITSPGDSAIGGATLTFDLLGYLSVDGSNCCTDTFSLTINGATMFSGGFDMGGGGSNFINYIDPGVTIVSSTAYSFFGGGLTQFSVDHTLLSGNNSYLFDYGTMQGLGDEGWGLENIIITADVSGGDGGTIPEPGVLALLGIGLAGLSITRKKKST